MNFIVLFVLFFLVLTPHASLQSLDLDPPSALRSHNHTRAPWYPQWGPFGDPLYDPSSCNGLGVLRPSPAHNGTLSCRCFTDDLWYAGIAVSGASCRRVSPTALFCAFAACLCLALCAALAKLWMLARLLLRGALPSRLSLVVSLSFALSSACLLATSLVCMLYPFGLATFRIALLLFLLSLSFLSFALAMYAGWALIYFASLLSHPFLLAHRSSFRWLHFVLATFFLLASLLWILLLLLESIPSTSTLSKSIPTPISTSSSSSFTLSSASSLSLSSSPSSSISFVQSPSSSILPLLSFLCILSSILCLLCILVELSYILFAFYRRFYASPYDRSSFFSRSFRYIFSLHLLLLAVAFLVLLFTPLDYALFPNKALTLIYYLLALAFVLVVNATALSTISDRPLQDVLADGEQAPVLFFPCTWCCCKMCRGYALRPEEAALLGTQRPTTSASASSLLSPSMVWQDTPLLLTVSDE